MERINRRTWRSAETLRWFARLEGYIDPGEKACFQRVATEARGQQVLDLGVGGGRTAALLLALTDQYVGIDYTPEMVAICRGKFPGVRIELGDARDLSRFADCSFQLVTFSFNGIDAVDLDGRRRVLAEVHRVLRPGGVFFFSTINQNADDFRGPPKSDRSITPTANPARLGARLLRYVIGVVTGRLRLARDRRFETREEGHAVLLHRAHDFGILVYATSLREIRAQLAAAGYQAGAEILGARSGKSVVEEPGEEEPYFHILARKPGSEPGQRRPLEA